MKKTVAALLAGAAIGTLATKATEWIAPEASGVPKVVVTTSAPLQAYKVEGLPEFVCAFDLKDLHRLSPDYKNAVRDPNHDLDCIMP